MSARHEFVTPLRLCLMPGCANKPWFDYRDDVCLPCAREIADRVERQDPEREERVLARKRNRGRAGWIYYVQVEKLIKIGFSTDLRKRLRAYPPAAAVLAYRPGTWDEEQELHRHFRALLHSGREWYRADVELLDHIATVPKHWVEGVTATAWAPAPPPQATKMRARSRR
ncbi:GIY-YIG nuclease family protein [Kineococcus radiotolerans]|uniref:Bacteriophage T5 Orf172 DNA-binding domain-containing protein n=1 Tax=Kineococcus radiotolerans (strain ATCC BAA-149 / DSM 14245 / SRS30216) TaxID=266940 RepID=A6W8S6_KINRD|nr:GIY-YIG nuclease family protein [Kineococcus radiotolerans]ABS03215.1 hypothetical protein Krad_1729 [Kineococcus radiotolerans SRS30216 = ATCC BAA-149]